nr:hypothetical protein [Rosenbergiella nectarea]
MVRAILDGRKTQTRRVIKNQPAGDWPEDPVFVEYGDNKFKWKSLNYGESAWFDCPFGKVGDRLWVRETFATLSNEDGHPIDWDNNLVSERKDSAKFYRASCCQTPNNYGLWTVPDRDSDFEGPWTPSIHMPRWASRIMLEITDIRVERLNDISEEDAKAEGAPTECCVIGDKYFLGFRSLWKSIYGQDSWQSNPFVWVIEFKRVEEV